MIINHDIDVASGATTTSYVQVPIAGNLLACRTVSNVEMTGTNTITVSDGTTDVVTASDMNAAAGTPVSHALEAASVVKPVEFSTTKPIKLALAIQAGDDGHLNVLLELDEFVRQTD